MSLTVPIYGFGGGGGGSELNFDVKDFRTEAELLASAGRENRIGVITLVPMTSWRFDANQPENLQEGEVWISVGTSSPVEFDALKKNGIKVYPLSAKQYVNGALQRIDAMSCQNGEWMPWVTYLFKGGVGGNLEYIENPKANITAENEKITVSCSTFNNGDTNITTPISYEGENKIMYVDVLVTSTDVGDYAASLVAFANKPTTITYPSKASIRKTLSVGNRQVVSMPLRSGQWYLGIAGAYNAEIYDMWLEGS